MSKDAISLTTGDVTAFARALARQLNGHQGTPSHLTLLNMLARSAGFRNFQHLRASHAADRRLSTEPAEAVDHALVERALNQFSADGHLQQWPSRRAVQDLCLWPLWSRIPARRDLTEKDVNSALNEAHDFGDPAILRRSLVTVNLLTRRIDGSQYRRVERRPPPEARALMERLPKRHRANSVGS
ncbi:MAG: DUF2087 domain-containing protein [Pseudomonadota bacterium]